MKVALIRPRRGGVADVVASLSPHLATVEDLDVIEVVVDEAAVPLVGAWRFMRHERALLAGVDVVHVEFGKLSTTLFFIALVASRAGFPVVAVVHDPPDICKNPGAGVVSRSSRWASAVAYRLLSPVLDARLVRLFVTTVPLLVTLSAIGADQLRAVGARAVVVVDHGHDPPRCPATAPSQGTYVLAAGNVGPNKGLDVLAEAWQLVGPASPFRLVVAGDLLGSKDQEWWDLTRAALARGDNPAELLGHVDLDELESLMAGAAVVVLPYLTSNPASGILVRAMVEGRAVVATPVPAVRDSVVDGVSARIVPAGDPGALADALKEVLSDGGLRDRLGTGAGAAANARFTWPRHVGGLLRAYALIAPDSSANRVSLPSVPDDEGSGSA